MKVSVCIATFNGARYLKEQMDSILEQKFVKNLDVEMEIIVSDDMSTDETLEILNSYNDDRIKVYVHTNRRLQKHYTALAAATANFDNAMRYANGDYIFLSDQDDIWYPNKIDEMLEILRNEGGVVAADFDVINGEGNNIGRMYYKEEPFWRIKRNYMPYGFSLGISREEMKYIMPLPNVHQHDSFISLIAQRRGKLHYLHTVTAAHRWFGYENTSLSASDESFYRKIWVRVKMYYFVLWRCLINYHDCNYRR